MNDLLSDCLILNIVFSQFQTWCGVMYDVKREKESVVGFDDDDDDNDMMKKEEGR